MQTPQIPADEQARKAALDALAVLDTPPEARFDELTQLVASLCETPIALVSLVDTDRQWFKSRHGLAASETPRAVSFCGHAILGSDIFEVQDARLTPQFCDNPLVTGEPRVAFYAGAPLVTSSGHRIGTLCVIDHKPRSLNPLQRKVLVTLAGQVVALLEQRSYRESAQQLSAQLQEAQQTARVGSWQYNLRTGEQSWSAEHYRIFEIEEPQSQEALHRMYRERIHPEDLPELDRLIERALTTGEGFIYDHRVFLDGGARIKYVQGIGKVTRDAFGKPVLVSGTCRDRTWDVESENRYRALIETMSEGLVVQASDGRITAHNPAALRILGLSSDQLHGRTSMDPRWRSVREDGSDFPGQEHPAMVSLRSGRPVTDVTMGLHLPEGSMRWIKINSVPMEGPQGRTVTTTFTDITDLVQSQAKTLQSAKLASLGEMAAGIAHEINNPLAVIAGNLHLLSKLREDPARFQSKLDAATRATDRVTKIVNGLRKFSRSSEGLYRSPEKISALVAEALVLVETKAKRQSVNLSSDLRSDAVIECDGLEIEQVIVNLVNNAIDAAHAHPDASAPRWVRIESYDDPSGPVLRVLDSGSGITPEVEKRLFEPFFTTKPVGQGTGLGLSIARGILQDHGATLSLNRSLPQTCFEVRFARAP